MILVDSPAWIDYDRANRSPAHVKLAHLVADSRDELTSSEPILMELLAGCRTSDAERRVRHLLSAFHWTPCDPVADFEGAAQIYRHCRAAGVTPRSMVDCMIATIALRTDAQVLTSDRDFEQMATVVPLRLAVA